MAEIIYQIRKSDTDILGSIRCVGGLKAASDENYIWIRGINESLALQSGLRQLPVQHSYFLDKDNHLFVPGCLTPVSILKEMQWQTLEKFIPVEIPVAAMPGKANSCIPVVLVPSEKPKPGAALMTSLAHWKRYGETASVVRLRQLVFAVSENNEVLILGHPLPPLPGKEYSIHKNILLPAGYDFEISMVATFIQERFSADQQNIILFDAAGSYQIIARHSFVPAKRSAIRLTKEEIIDLS